jgi:glycosyltransferase involved in cell wall biosynthesis
MNRSHRPVLLYTLHSGNLYGTERMALVTLEGLRAEFRPVLFAPEGPALEEARRLGIEAEPFEGAWGLARALWPYLRQADRVAFAATGVAHSLLFIALNTLWRRQAVHLHLVHGGTDERLSYGRKPLLNHWRITLVAVSGFVRERLLAHGAKPESIAVCENFLPDRQIDNAPRRPPFERDGVRRVAIVSRVDPIKRIDLLLEALDRHPGLSALNFAVFGTGWDLEALRSRAATTHPNLRFEGFQPDVARRLVEFDLLLHLCPSEPFGLAILEAMAAGLPVLTPDQGGAAGLVAPGESGFHFKADQADDLAAQLEALQACPAERLNDIVVGADHRLRLRYSETVGLARYAALLNPLCGEA